MEMICNSFYAIEIDSLKIINSDTVYYHFDVIRRDTSTLYDCQYKRLPNWTGSKTIIKINGENIFLARNGDSIRIETKAELNDKWHIYDFPGGNYFEGEVTSKYLGSVIGNNDSIKVITLSLKDNSGNPIAHNFNGKEIILSKDHGIIRAYDFFYFPNDTATFILSGLSNPVLGIQNITAREIFDYNVGDEFHIEDAESHPFSVPYYSKFDTERVIILSKSVSLNEDTLDYEYERLLYSNKNNWFGSTGKTITKDTLTQKYIVSQFQSLNDIPIKTLPETYPLNNCLTNSSINNRLTKWEVNFFFTMNDTCYSQAIGSGFVSWYYIDGLGGYYNGDEWPSQSHRTLLYYKKGLETWGTPVNFSALLSTAEKIKSEINIEIFPNPFSDFTKIKINNHNGSIYKLTVVDIYGKEVKEISFSENEIILNTDGLINGLYIYKIQNDKNQISSGKLLIIGH